MRRSWLQPIDSKITDDWEFLLAGGVCLVWGGINLLRARKVPMERAA